jgi:hypothetical protein
MILSKKQLAKRIKNIGGQSTVYFYERAPEPHEKLKDIRRVNMFPKASAQTQIDRLEEFAEESPQGYFVHVTTSGVSNPNNGIQVFVDLGISDDFEQMEGTSNVYKSPEELTREIRAQVLKELEEERRIREIEEREEQLRLEKEEIMTAGGKMFLILKTLANGFMQANKQNTNTSTMNGTEQNEVNESEYLQAVKYLTDLLGKEDFIKLANKVKSNPSILGVVKNFIN